EAREQPVEADRGAVEGREIDGLHVTFSVLSNVLAGVPYALPVSGEPHSGDPGPRTVPADRIDVGGGSGRSSTARPAPYDRDPRAFGRRRGRNRRDEPQMNGALKRGSAGRCYTRDRAACLLRPAQPE